MQRLSLLRTAALSLGSSLALTFACTPQARPADIQSPDALSRGRAIEAIVKRNDRKDIPLLVDRLEDEDQAVRFFAILGLEHLTGTRLGYLYYKPPSAQVDAIVRWRAYAGKRNGPGASSAPASESIARDPAASKP